MSADTPRNVAVPDELAAVRAQLKALETKEAELRQVLLSDPSARTGAEWVAEIKTVTTSRTDLKELRANHPKLVDEFTFLVDVVRVVLSGITEDGELVSARQMRTKEKAT